jgi:hypothetical protein
VPTTAETVTAEPCLFKDCVATLAGDMQSTTDEVVQEVVVQIAVLDKTLVGVMLELEKLMPFMVIEFPPVWGEL